MLTGRLLNRQGPMLGLRARKLAWMVRRRRWSLLRSGVGPSIEHAELLRGREFGSVVDVGANVGQFALWAQEALGPRRIVCIEPQADAIREIRKLAKRSSCPIEVVEAALGARPGRASLFVTEANDSSSLLGPEPSLGGRGFRIAATCDVSVITGDEAVASFELVAPVLVKIDVQGTEVEVLRGMAGLLERAQAVLVEVSFVPMYEGQSDPSAVVERLFAFGFRLAGVARVPGTGVGWALDQADLLFERPTQDEER